MFEASPFSLNMFQLCPRQYKFQYIDHLGGIYRKSRPYFTMGDHVHATLKDFLSVVPVSERNLPKLEALLREKWHRNRKGFTGKEDEKNWGEKALNQLRRFAQHHDIIDGISMMSSYYYEQEHTQFDEMKLTIKRDFPNY